MRTDEEQARYMNELIMAGALHAALVMADLDVENVTDNGDATPELWVKVGFLKSRYRITVTMDPEEEREAT